MAKPTQNRRPAAPPPRNAARQTQRQSAPAPRPQSREVATVKSNAAVPSFIQETLEEDSGAGLSTDMSDNLTPLIYILQALSPQAQERNEAYIEGAKAGSIWLRNAGDLQLQDGDEGIIFQPCHFNKVWIEWKPNRGGFVRRHAEMPAEAEQKNVDPQNPDRLAWVMPSGNVIVETREHAGIVHIGDDRLPYVIPFSSTGHTVSRGWMTTMNRKIVNGKRLPSYGYLYRLSTVYKQNDAGDWFMFKVDDVGYVESVEDYEAGKTLNIAFESGERRAADAVDTGEDIPGDVENTNSGRAAKAGI